MPIQLAVVMLWSGYANRELKIIHVVTWMIVVVFFSVVCLWICYFLDCVCFSVRIVQVDVFVCANLRETGKRFFFPFSSFLYRHRDRVCWKPCIISITIVIVVGKKCENCLIKCFRWKKDTLRKKKQEKDENKNILKLKLNMLNHRLFLRLF